MPKCNKLKRIATEKWEIWLEKTSKLPRKNNGGRWMLTREIMRLLSIIGRLPKEIRKFLTNLVSHNKLPRPSLKCTGHSTSISSVRLWVPKKIPESTSGPRISLIGLTKWCRTCYCKMKFSNRDRDNWMSTVLSFMTNRGKWEALLVSIINSRLDRWDSWLIISLVKPWNHYQRSNTWLTFKDKFKIRNWEKKIRGSSWTPNKLQPVAV